MSLPQKSVAASGSRALAALALSATLATLIFASFATFVRSTAGEERPAARPLVVAHRGLLLDAPEDTLANYRACLELRIGFEFDVRRSKDGVLVCIHDDTVDRTTDGQGRVDQMTLAQLKALDAGSWFGRQFRGERIPTVDDVFALLARHKATQPKEAAVLVAVDLKGDDDAIEADVIRLAQQHDVLDRLLFIGRAISLPEVRERLLAADKSAQVACVANNAEEFPAALADKRSSWVYVRYVPSREEVTRVHEAGKRTFIAGPTVAGHEPENWQAATERGVDAILTDYSLELCRRLKSER
jgi:glycerophosphoryl diester phosphodiesterase